MRIAHIGAIDDVDATWVWRGARFGALDAKLKEQNKQLAAYRTVAVPDKIGARGCARGTACTPLVDEVTPDHDSAAAERRHSYKAARVLNSW